MNIRKFTGREVVNALRSATGILFNIPLDGEYFLPEGTEGLRDVVRQCRVYTYRYASDRSDCDNFAMALSGLAGLITRVNCMAFVRDPDHESGDHAYNIGLCHVAGRIQVWAVEPQSSPAGAIRTATTISKRATVVMG